MKNQTTLPTAPAGQNDGPKYYPPPVGHTPLPWAIGESSATRKIVIHEADPFGHPNFNAPEICAITSVLVEPSVVAAANAEFIVRAVNNSHEDLLAELKDAAAIMEHYLTGKDRLNPALVAAAQHAHAAIAAATKGGAK